ncbi:MAG TPA: alanine--tRNA ligase [Gemmatimonadaceae bacterium]
MQSADIRTRFLQFFERNGHRILSSAPLVPQDDPTLLFVNAGMVPFKRMFLGGEEPVPGRRATTSQKCVRAGGKHNDLEQVGHTARHHTFFEMLGNFSFGDYFKRDAIRFAWEFLTEELAMDPAHLRVTVYHGDDEAPALWGEIAGLAPTRIYSLGEKDNFWQMAETGPCGPCSEIYVDLAHVTDDWAPPQGASGEWTELDRTEFSHDAFVEGAEAGRFLEFWTLVFMQYDRQEDGTLVPLPKPSVDTGMGLERITAVLQRRSNNFHTDLFTPLLDAVSAATKIPYDDSASHRVIADHARAVAFLLADGVFPSNEGRGYVLRRILRRAVRHAWLLGRDQPLLHHVVGAVIRHMGNAWPELKRRERHIIDTTRAEEERFLATIAGGMKRFDEIAPTASTQGSTAVRGTISGEEAFRLYDTFGFPLDLTELMARERGYTVDVQGFEQALSRQREQSREDRKGRDRAAAQGTGEVVRASGTSSGASEFVGYDELRADTRIAAVTQYPDGRLGVALERTPFYVAGGGQISDVGEIAGDGWTFAVEDVRREDGRPFAVGTLSGDREQLLRAVDGSATVTATVPRSRRLDTERNHTATHLLHAALREVLGDHVHQAGSLVAPDRLRFDFTHHGPVTREQLDDIERRVNEGIFAAEPVVFEQKSYAEALALGAMALFGEKYGDVVRVVSIPGRSMELCGGTHVRNTSEIGLFRIVSESGIAAGVRRIEAYTGPRAFELMRERERELGRVAELVRAAPDVAAQRVKALVEERRTREKNKERGESPGAIGALLDSAVRVNGARIVAASVEVPDVKALQETGDLLRAQLGSGVGVLAASFAEGKNTILLVVTDDLRDRGLRADALIREVAAVAGGKGGGKPHMAQAGIADAARIPEVLSRVAELVTPHLQAAR